jgi:hypothetical protein
MEARPFLSQGIDALERSATASWHDPRALAQLCRELRHRPTPPARALLRRIEDRLDELGCEAAPDDRDVVALLLAVETLRARLAAARRRIEAQAFILEGLKAALDEAERRTGPADPYRRVHVLETIPDFALRALRHAFLRQYHPDRVPEAARAAALEAFVAYDEAFREIARRRGAGSP